VPHNSSGPGATGARRPHGPPDLAAAAAYVLGRNTAGDFVKPAPALYPHQWSWDAAFISIGLARLDLPAARANLSHLFRGQWRNGMVPHIVFDPAASGYFPGPDRWHSTLSADAPSEPLTSGICQPPVHSTAVLKTVQAAQEHHGRPLDDTMRWARDLYPKLLAWHRFLARERMVPTGGLVRIFHGWESGMDNSPRWDAPYSRVVVGPDLAPYRRRDTEHVADAGQRPTDEEYDRYLWLVEEAKRARYDQAELARTGSFNVGDVFFTAILAAACADLAHVASVVGAPDGAELAELEARAREAVLARVSAMTGMAADLDLRTGEELTSDTVAGFAPLLAGGAPRALAGQLVATLLGPGWAGSEGMRWPLPPSTATRSPAFRPRTYWRGPVWPVTTWLLATALERQGEAAAAAALQAATLQQVDGTRFAEYYEPYSGEPLGSPYQSWTAAVVLDWVAS
jgi:glucosylglycerate hydrolase